MSLLQKKGNNYKGVESTRGTEYVKPYADIIEGETDFSLIFDLPGMEKNDISLNVEKGVLTVTAECTKKADEGYSCLRQEAFYTGYKRSFNLNETVNIDEISADFKDGVLSLKLPKKEEQKRKEIDIKIG